MTARITLSQPERAQLGTRARSHPYPTAQEWPRVRRMLVAASAKSNAKLDPELTAYTPGETLRLLANGQVTQWHRRLAHFRVPAGYDTVVFVPCAKSKPWTKNTKSAFYQAYHDVIDGKRFAKAYFVTVSEPLGVVPQDLWGSFPHYDDPGLFNDTAMQSSMTTAAWADTEFRSKRQMPFDRGAYDRCIDTLAGVIGKFMATNRGKRFIGFVADPAGSLTTHDDMLRRAAAQTGLDVRIVPKKAAAGRDQRREAIRAHVEKTPRRESRG